MFVLIYFVFKFIDKSESIVNITKSLFKIYSFKLLCFSFDVTKMPICNQRLLVLL